MSTILKRCGKSTWKPISEWRTRNALRWITIFCHSTQQNNNQECITLRWIKDGDDDSKMMVTQNVPIGTSILEAAHQNGIELEGACESSLACSTCHVILEDPIYDQLAEPNDDEYDLLDQAFGLTETSRLGCQIAITLDMDNMLITLPKATRNFYVDDGFKPH